jgi:hypothetical protein
MADETFEIDSWIYSTLSSDATIQGLVSTRIYEGFAPQGAAVPSIIFQEQEPFRDIRAIGAIRIMVNGVYLIKAVTTANAASLKPILNRIDTLFDAKSSVNPNITILSCVRERIFRLNESRDQIIYRHRGSFWRIQAQITV